jgi:hypothetical protein
MDNCAICNKQVDEREIQDFSLDFLELSLCLSCDGKYSDEELIELIEGELTELVDEGLIELIEEE